MKRFFFLLSLLISVSIGQVWGADPTISWAFKTLQTTSGTQDGITWETGKTGSATATACNSSNGLVLYGVSSGGGYFQTTSAISGTITNVNVVSTAKKNTPKYTVYCSADGSNWTAIASDQTAGTKDHAVTGSYAYVKLANTTAATAQLAVTSITVTYTPSGGSAACATPSFTPAAGTFFGSQEITITTSTTGASIYYTEDGSTPSSSNGTLYEDPFTIDETTTIKAIAIKDGATDSEIAVATYTKGTSVTSFDIDFETNNLAAYVNWDFVNIGIKSATITAHGGTYYGANINSSGNGVTTASITTKEKYAKPGTLTFFISKESTNTSASNWVVQVSGDGETWDNVDDASFDAKSMTKGTWKECSANLSAYSNVYVRISYGSSGAIRAIDDISLTTASSVAKPTISGETPFLNTTDVTISIPDGTTVYYTTNGSDPTTNSTEYTAPFSLTESATVKAIAVKGNDVSAVASKEFTKIAALTTMAEVQAAAESTEKGINVSINNWVVTAVSSNQVWIADADNEKGIILYKSGHGFVAGNKINGTVIGTKIKLYNDYPELTSLVASEVTMTTADAVTPQTKSIADLTNEFPNTQGTVVAFENLTYTSNVFSDGTNTIAVDTRFISNVVTLVNDAVYNVTGVVFYGSNHAIKIMPRSADDVEQVSGGGLPEVDGLAALKAEDTGSSYLVTLTNAVVTFADDKNAFIEDVAAGALIYYQNGGHGLVAGDKLNGQYEVTTATFNGKFEITAMIAQTGAETTHNAEIPVTTLTIAQLNANFAANESRRIKVVGVNVTDAIANNDRNGEISDGTNTIILYAGKNGVEASLNNNIDAIGYPTFYVTNNANQRQLAVWAQSDITVNVKEDPELSYSPASATIEVGDTWTAPTLNNSHNLTLSYESSNPDVATVSNTGVIALVENAIGSATITASFAGNETYNAGSATYTITVKEASAPLSPWASVYTSNITLSTASGTSASAAKVVYNSTQYEALKAGTGSVQGAVVVTVPAGATTLHFHAYGWKGETVALTVEAPAGVTVTPSEAISINSDEGVTGNSPFTLSTGADPKTDAYYAVALSGNSSETALRIKATSGKRFVVFGVNQEGAATPASIAADPTSLAFGSVEQGAEVEAKTINVTLTEVAAATVALSGEGASAFSIDKAALSESGAITVTPNTTTVGSYAATITISDNASEADPVEVAVSMTVRAPEVPDVCDGTDDFNDELSGETATSYKDRSTTNGWTATNAQWTTINEEKRYFTINGKTTTVGVITSPVLSDGIGSLKIRYANMNAETNGVSFKVEIKKGENVEKVYTITKANADVTQGTLYTETIEDINEVGDFQIVITNLCPTNSTSNKDRVSIGKLCWTNYSAPVVPEPVWTVVRTGLEPGRFYTICMDKNILDISGASFWGISKRDQSGSVAYLEEESDPYAAGKPFLFYATSDKLEVVYGTETTTTAGTNGALHGTLDGINTATLAGLQNDALVCADLVGSDKGIYMMYQNAFHPLGTNNHLDANRAYLVYCELEAVSTDPQSTPGRQVRKMPLQGNVATGIEEGTNADNTIARKVMIDGQLFILRGEKMYDATGAFVK